MLQPQLIAPPPVSTPPGPGAGRRSRDLPPDVLREASRRLGVVSLTVAALYVVGWVLDRLAMRAMSHGGPAWTGLAGEDVILALGTLTSVALFVYSRRAGGDPRFILDLGQIYLIATTLTLGLLMHWHAVPGEWPVSPSISWSGVAIVMFAGIVPSTPGKTLAAGLIAASMNPVSMLVARARGSWDFGPASNVLVMHYPDYLLVGVAVVISRVVTGLGQQVARAREMGSYHLGELLGRGGMGEVYAASHRMFARPAAIKLIRPDVVAPGDAEGAQLAVRRFRREAEAAAQLRSPHTVALYDFGVTEDQTLYFVMELLDGMDLQAMVREHGPMGASRAIHVLRQMCDSLEEAHARGLVHRDVKPANVHIGRVGLRHDFVKVLDFGLVKSLASESLGESQATAAGIMTPGTPAFMAPEAFLGETVDGRADVYAVGCVAYYLLTGQLVFEADTALKMVAQHLRSAPIPPGERAPGHVPRALDRLVLSCLSKQPAGRPTAAELGRSLAAVEVPAWTEAEAEEWWRAHVATRA